MSVVKWEGEFQTKQNWMTVRQILSLGKQAATWACQGEKQTAQRREGLPARVWRVKRQTRNDHDKERKVFLRMAGQIFMRVDEVAEELGVSKPYAYKLIKRMNEELAQTGCITIAGRIDRKFFHEKFYGTRTETKRKEG